MGETIFSPEDLADGLQIISGESNTGNQGDGTQGGEGAGEGGEGAGEGGEGAGEGGEGQGGEGAGGSGEGSQGPTEQELQKLQEHENKIISEIFGERFKSIDEVKSYNVGERLTEYDNLRQNVSNLTEENKLLSEQLSSYNTDTFQGLLKFSKFAEDTGIKDYSLYNRLLNTEVKDLDYAKAIAFLEVVETPELLPKATAIEEDIKRQFKQGIYQDDEEDTEGNVIGKVPDPNADLRLEKEGLKAKKRLSDLKDKISTIQLEKKDYKKEREDYIANWDKTIPEILKHYKNVKIRPIKISGDVDKDGKPTEIVFDNVNYAITEPDKEIIGKMMKTYITNNNIPLTKEKVVDVYKEMFATFEAMREDNIRTLLAQEVWKMAYTKATSKFNNTTMGRKAGGDAGEGGFKQEEGTLTDDQLISKYS